MNKEPLPWFILDEVLKNTPRSQLLKLRLLNKHCNTVTTGSFFETFSLGGQYDAFSLRNLKTIFNYGHLCRILIFPREGLGLEKLESELNFLFWHFKEVRSLRFYSTDEIRETILGTACKRLPKLKHVSVYSQDKFKTETDNLELPSTLISLFLCDNEYLTFDEKMWNCSLPSLKKLVIVASFSDDDLFPKDLSKRFPCLTYFHTLATIRGVECSLFDVDVSKHFVKSVGKLCKKDETIKSIKFHQGYSYTSAASSESDLFLAHYKVVFEQFEGILGSQGTEIDYSVIKEFSYHSAKKVVDKSKLLELPHVETLIINVETLEEISLVKKIYHTTKLVVHGFKESSPGFIQWLLDYFPSLSHLEINGPLHAFSWTGSFTSLNVLKTRETAFPALSKLISASPNLKLVCSNVGKETKLQLHKSHPGIPFYPYGGRFNEYSPWLSEYDEAAFIKE